MAENKKNVVEIDPGTVDKMRNAAQWLAERKGTQIEALDVAGLCDIAEGVVIATAGSVRHAQALADYVLEKAKETKTEYFGMEGYKAGTWILVDMNDVLVHVFQQGARGFYNIEGLWAEARPVELDLPEEEPADDNDF